jgi:hypothetical protein
MAEKSLVNEAAVTATVVAVLPAVVAVVLVLDELLHAVSTTAAVNTDTALLRASFIRLLLIESVVGDGGRLVRNRTDGAMNKA